MTAFEMKQLSDLRSVLEGFAARNAAAHAAHDAACRARLTQSMDEFARAVRRNDYAALRAADTALHRQVMVAARVPCLPEAWGLVWEALSGLHELGFRRCFPDRRSLIGEHARLVDMICRGEPAAAEDAARSHVEAVWLRLAEREKSFVEPDPVARAAAHLAFRLGEKLKLAEIARNVAFSSPGHLSQLFHDRYGLGFRGYLRRLRLDKAEELLRSTRLPVRAIARRVGYGDASRFCEHFKHAYGAPPARWRSRRKEILPSRNATRRGKI